MDANSTGGVRMTPYEFPISLKDWWCGAAWFLISSQKISGEPKKTHKEELHKLLFFAIIMSLVL
jgi:hypothetical protein